MKHLIGLLALSLIVSGCGKKDERAAEPAAPVAETADATEETAEETQPPQTQADAAPDQEALEVVEESAGTDSEAGDEAIVLAQADAPPQRDWKFREGPNFTRMVPTQPTVGSADKIEVAEIFMYSCPHCYDLENYINQWAENKDPNVRFVRIPASFNQLAVLHAQLYYTEEELAENGDLKDQIAFRRMVFEEFHRRGNRLTSLTAIQRVFARAGVSEEDFERTWNSFEVDQKLRLSADLTRRYGIQSVPMVVVNGKYRTDAAMAGSYSKLMELIDELTEREGLR